MSLPRPAPGRAKIWLLATVLLVAATAIAVWWGLAATVAKPNWQTLTWEIKDDREATVIYQLSKPPDMTVVCVAEALGADHALVGSRDITIGPTEQREATYTALIRTTTRAVTANLRNCREAPAAADS